MAGSILAKVPDGLVQQARITVHVQIIWLHRKTYLLGLAVSAVSKFVDKALQPGMQVYLLGQGCTRRV